MCEIKRKNIENKQRRVEESIEKRINETYWKNDTWQKDYQRNKEEATEHKSKCLSMSIDGADFQRYGLPYFPQHDKDSERGFKNPIRTVGAIVHGHGNLFYTFPANLPSDLNCTIYCLHYFHNNETKIFDWKS